MAAVEGRRMAGAPGADDPSLRDVATVARELGADLERRLTSAEAARREEATQSARPAAPASGW